MNFATVVRTGKERPVATHRPCVVKQQGDQLILSSHIARANPQWKSLTNRDLLTIFNQPHAYISPSHYETKENVPTWNYLAVHAYGKANLIQEPSQIFEVMEEMIRDFEPAYLNQWEDLSMEYKTGLARGVVAFEIQVSHLEFKKKISQNRSEKEQENIIKHLVKDKEGVGADIAAYMQDERGEKSQ